MTYQLTKLSLKSTIICAVALAACATSTPSDSTSIAINSEPATAPTMSNIKVNVTGFDAQQGYVMAALVDAEGYKGGKNTRGARVLVDGDTVKFEFNDVPSGEYAIRMFQDVNSDGTMNSNAFGIPTEPFAFSNNATGTMGPAPWSKAKFIASGATVQNISF